jgi:hypothetical protein
MYAATMDDDAAILIGVYAGTEQTDADHERGLEFNARADRNATARGLAYVHILVVEDATDTPSPRWRRRFAESRKAITSVPHYFALVTESRVARGIMTAVTWLTGAPPGHYTSTFATFAEACAWIRTQTGQVYPQLEGLYDRARMAANESRRTTAER